MAVARYTAKRSLISGHTVGGVYSLDIALADLDLQPGAVVNEAAAMNGDTYGLRIRGERKWRCQTGPVQGAAVDALAELLDSVDARERFEFAPYDKSATPSPRWRWCVLDDPYRIQRVAMRPGGGEQDYFTFQFTLREVP